MKNIKIMKVMVGLVIFIFLAYIGILLFGNKTNTTSDTASTITTTAITSVYTTNLVSAHNSSLNCWIIVNNKVYDVTRYINQHPGGAKDITDYCGKDATTAYKNRGGHGTHSSQANTLLEKYLIGSLSE